MGINYRFVLKSTIVTSVENASESPHQLLYNFFKVQWDFGFCGHCWPIVPAPDDR
jgi:hypothetical protein